MPKSIGHFIFICISDATNLQNIHIIEMNKIEEKDRTWMHSSVGAIGIFEFNHCHSNVCGHTAES